MDETKRCLTFPVLLDFPSYPLLTVMGNSIISPAIATLPVVLEVTITEDQSATATWHDEDKIKIKTSANRSVLILVCLNIVRLIS